ncbi:MAG: hypothetical protein AB7K36_11770 [Chloroflexota bacterium]
MTGDVLAAPEHQRQSPGAPPWLWLWGLGYLWALPEQLSAWVDVGGMVGSLLHLTQTMGELVASGDLRQYAETFLLLMAGLGGVLGSGLSAALLVGIAYSAVPWLRGRRVERRYGLTEPPGSVPALAEMADFLRVHAPELVLRANLRRARTPSFVYPRGYGRVGMAVFGPMVMRWTGDRRAAEATLLHEIAHFRRGDAYLTGVGSLFENVIRIGLIGYVAAYVVIVLAALLSIGQFDLGMLMAALLRALFQIGGILTLPLACIWAFELGADRIALDHGASRDALMRALDVTSGGARGARRLWQGLVTHVSHPPRVLRRALLQQTSRVAAIVLIGLYPAAFCVRLVLLHGSAFIAYRLVGYRWDEILTSSVVNTLYFLAASADDFALMAVVTAAWPQAVIWWVRLFSGSGLQSARQDQVAYWVMAAILALCSTSFYLAGTLAPAA